jgi:Zn-dependent protease with chaperone function
MTSYRYPNETLVLGLTLLLVGLVIAITALATVCASVVFVLLAIVWAYISSRSHHQNLVRAAYPVTENSAPGLTRLFQESAARLKPGPLQAFVVPSRQLNAYTFGLDDPKVVVLYSALLDVMDADELRFIIGHEMGHVALGHTRLNSLVGGLAGIPSSSLASAVLVTVFLWWNRTCEFSADRAGLLAVGRPEKAVTALIKLIAGPSGKTAHGLELAYQRIDAEDDTWLGSLQETFASHPMLIRRINALRQWASSEQYRRLQAEIARQSTSSVLNPRP